MKEPVVVGSFVLTSLLVAPLAGPPEGGDSAPNSSGPAVTLVDSIRLAESEEHYVGRPLSILVDDLGTYWISDMFHRRVFRFGPGGEFLSALGGPGGGPGEFVGPPWLIDVSPQGVIVLDSKEGRAQVFDPESGDPIGGVSLRPRLRTVFSTSEALWLGGLDFETETSVARWIRADALAARNPPRASRVPIPQPLLESRSLASIFDRVHPVAWSDSLLVGFMALDELRLADLDGRILDTVEIPNRLRRGVPKDIGRLFDPTDRSFPELFSMVSALFGMNRQSNGSFLLVHFDQEIEDRLITAKVYASLVAPDLERACVDAPVPVSRDAQPRIAFRGDTLVVLDQVITETGEAAATVKKYLVSGAGCRWIETSG